jgi:hypothetical protein
MYSLWLTKSEQRQGSDLDADQEISSRYICILTLQEIQTREPVHSVYQAGPPSHFLHAACGQRMPAF